jgi:hypothetical protein
MPENSERVYLDLGIPNFLQLQDPSEINGDNLNNTRRETSRHFRNKKREYQKDKIDEIATNSRNKNQRNK